MNILKNSLLLNKNFSLFFFGQSLSTVGDGFKQMAIIYLIFEMGGGGMEVALSQFCLMVPRILVLLWGGVVVDRLNAKTVIWTTDLFRFIITAILVVCMIIDSLTFPFLYFLLSLSGVISGFFYPAFSSIVPSIVEEKDLERANAGVQSISQIAMFIGPPLAGLLITYSGITIVFIANALSYLIASLTGIFIKINKQTLPKMKKSTILKDVSEGFQQVWNVKWLRTLLLVDLIGGLAVVGPLQVILPVYSKESLGLGSSQLGIVMGAFGIGSLIGMVIVSKLKSKYKTIRSYYFLEIFQGAVLFLIAIPSLWVVLTILCIVGILNGISGVIMTTQIQAHVPMNKLGRTMSIVALASFGAVPISQLFSGWITEHAPLAIGFILASILLSISGLFGVVITKKQGKVTFQTPAVTSDSK